MSKFTDKYNNGSARYEFDTKDLSYHKLQELYTEFGKNSSYIVRALYINTKGKFGDAPVACVTLVNDTSLSYMVNLPTHLLATVKEMREDSELTDDINKGYFGLQIYEYHDSKFDKDCYSVNWLDLIPENEQPKGDTIDIKDSDLPF